MLEWFCVPCSVSCGWMLWIVLRQAPKLRHGEHRVTANNGEKQGSEQRELVWWVFTRTDWESVATCEVP